ncbi:hypothetical protein [Schleiferilactobacillus shenzhenensis]|uniref:Uncharacterized protein n=1 Tax=Schleiferilactobacillus shenzhenensis LY-73 TaxID=1231336 RepID=U4TQP6_9LACO|nr:hypothetical protein [Schleiferilactobacillus shenzhenensis]ERL66544.1 hypothetical protein L248_0223 [Schleiferilactobacillus shenzhenensis LY-73]
MKRFRALLYRNTILYWQYVRVRWILISAATVVLLTMYRLRQYQISTVFFGVVQRPGSFDLPMTWLFMVFSPLLVVGGSVHSLVHHDYPPVSTTPFSIYLGSIMVLAGLTTFVMWTVWVLLIGNWHSVQFSLTILVILCVLNWGYGIVQIFVSPILAQLIFLALLLACIAFNDFPFLSQLMFSRFAAREWVTTVGQLVITCAGLLVLARQTYRLDF